MSTNKPACVIDNGTGYSIYIVYILFIIIITLNFINNKYKYIIMI